MSLQTSQPLVVNDNVSVTSDDTSSQDSMLSYIKKSGPSFKLNFDEDPTFWKLNDSKYRHFLSLKVQLFYIIPRELFHPKGRICKSGFSLIF